MDDFEPLDIAACYGTDATSQVIRWGTASAFAPSRLRIGPSHVAVLCEHDGQMLWVESTTLCSRPCLLNGEFTSGAQAHLPEDRIADYVDAGGHVDLYRLSPIDRLTADESAMLTDLLVRHFIASGVRYDTGGAIVSGTRLFKRTRLLTSDLDSLFCSELIAAVLQRLCRMNRANPTQFNPACLLRQLVREGTYGFERSYTEVAKCGLA